MKPDSCTCNICGCPSTGNDCTYDVCEHHYGTWSCVQHNRGQGYACQDYNQCIVAGHCDGNGNCSGGIGTGNQFYVCISDNPAQWYCGCSYNGSSFTCCDSNSPSDCTTPVPSCNNYSDNTYCDFQKVCN